MEIKINNKASRRNLGFGTYGPIVKGFFRDKKVAVKKVPLTELSENFEVVESALSQWDNPHTIKLLFAEEDAKFRYNFLLIVTNQKLLIFSFLGRYFAFEQCNNSLDQLIYTEKRFQTPRYKTLSCRKTANLHPKECKVDSKIVNIEETEQPQSSKIHPR